MACFLVYFPDLEDEPRIIAFRKWLSNEYSRNSAVKTSDSSELS